MNTQPKRRMRHLTAMVCGMLALLASLCSTLARAEQSITVVTSEFPPLTTNTGGQAGGIVADILREAGKRAGISLEFSFLPWQRAQQEVQSRDDVLIIPFTRMPSREAEYQWVAPVLEFKTVLVTLAEPPTSLEDARKLTIGFVGSTSFKDEVVRAGFTHVEKTNDDVTNARMLKAKRIDAWVTMDVMASGVYRQAGFNPAELKYGPVLGPVKVSYIAASPNFPKEIARKIANAVEQMNADGSSRAIINRYR